MKPYFQRHWLHNISDLAQEVGYIAQEVGDIAQEMQISRSLLRHKLVKSVNQHREHFRDLSLCIQSVFYS